MNHFFIYFFMIYFSILGQSVNTSLTKQKDIETFIDATNRIRCICLPSIPIQSCSYNMCVISSYLKTFIENRIREGKSSDEIVHGFQNGFKDTVDWENDSVIKHFIEEGNQGVIFNLQNGFGDKILAQPEPLWINGTLALFGIIALVGIGFYIKKMKENQSKTNTTNQNSKNLDTYLKEID